MLKTLLHHLVAIPAVYDFAQRVAGAPKVKQRVTPVFQSCIAEGSKVIDVGGGTGLNLSYIHTACDYICLDNDPQKLQGFHVKHPQRKAILGNTTKLPLAESTFDVALMSLVSHHLTDEQLRPAFEEIARVLKPSGIFIFLDALWEPRRFSSRALWRIDRGANPRAYEVLCEQTKDRFEIQNETRWAIYHNYVCWTLKPKGTADANKRSI